MKILDLDVNWMQGYANSPNFKITVDDFPDREKLRYDQKSSLYCAEIDGYVRFYSYSRPDKGFGGREYVIKMLDGTEKVLKGPWSSRAGAVNSLGFKYCVEASITTTKEIERVPRSSKPMYFSSAITVEKILEYLKEKPVCWLVEVRTKSGDIRFDPVPVGALAPKFVMNGFTSDDEWKFVFQG